MACVNLNLDVNVNSCLSGLWASLRLGRPKSSIQKLKKEMTILTGKRDDIKNKIHQAELEGRIPTNQVTQWLREVETFEGQVSDIEQEFQSISCFSCRCFDQTQTQQTEDQLVPIRRESSNCCSIVLKVAEKLGEVEKLMERADRLEPVDTVGPPETTVMLSMSHRPPVGIDPYVEDITGYVDDGEGDGIIGIYGMGGVGKTTILKSIQKHYHMIHSIFDPVIWVVASKDCQLKRLQMDIAKSLGLNTLQETDDERTRGEKLFRYLKNRNCLLLLDDIWEHLDLQLLGMALLEFDTCCSVRKKLRNRITLLSKERSPRQRSESSSTIHKPNPAAWCSSFLLLLFRNLDARTRINFSEPYPIGFLSL